LWELGIKQERRDALGLAELSRLCGFASICKKNHAATLSLLPPPRWDGEENQKEKRQKLMG